MSLQMRALLAVEALAYPIMVPVLAGDLGAWSVALLVLPYLVGLGVGYDVRGTADGYDRKAGS